jgi:hypothetical protein
MTSRFIHWFRDICVQPFGYFRLAGAIAALFLIPLCLGHAIISDPTILYAEGGPIEWLSVVFWVYALLFCAVALFRYHNRLDRLIFKWLSFICALAAARELDAQVLLNPQYLGQFGVRYRTDWFFSNKFKVSILLKLIWAGIFLVPLTFLIAPLFILRKPILRLTRNGDVATGLFLLGILGLAIGFVCDDTLRKTHFMSVNLRQSIEETAEMLGALFFLTGICCLFWNPTSQRLGSVELPYDETSDSGKQ